MTLLAASVVLLMLLLAREERQAQAYIAVAAVVCVAMYLVWLQEHLLGRIDFMISDEGYFFDRSSDPGFRWGSLTDHGYLWIAVNKWVTQVDLGPGGHGLKVLNIPIVLAFLVLIYRIFGRDRRVLMVPFILPYLLWLAIFNMRDVAILLAAAATIYGLLVAPRIRLSYVLPGAVGMILLRPEFFVVLVVVCGLTKVRHLAKIQLSQVMRVGAVAVVVAVLAGPVLVGRIDRVIAWAEYTKFVRYDLFVDARLGEYRTANMATDMVVSVARFVVTPFPHSLAGRIAEGGSAEWGLADDLVRFINQLGYYACLLFALSRIHRIRWLLKASTPGQLAMLGFLFAYTPIYGIHLFGVSHQRLKIPFQLCVALIAIGLAGSRHVTDPGAAANALGSRAPTQPEAAMDGAHR